MIIYQIQNKTNNKSYIGKTKNDIEKRVSIHIKAKSYIGNALRKYGRKKFNVFVIDYAKTEKELNQKEK